MQGKAQPSEAQKERLEALRSGLRGRAFTAAELTNYRKGGGAFQNLLCLVPVSRGAVRQHEDLGLLVD
jgi:hypothetical protein